MSSAKNRMRLPSGSSFPMPVGLSTGRRSVSLHVRLGRLVRPKGRSGA